MKKLIIIILLLIIGVGTLGLTWAVWTRTLVINGTVNSGRLGIRFVDNATSPKITDPQTSTMPDMNCLDSTFESPEYVAENVGWGEFELNPAKDTLTIRLKKVYPGYYNEISFRPRNNGTIPERIENAEIFVNPAEPPVATITAAETVVPLDLDDDGNDDIAIRWVDDNFDEPINASSNGDVESVEFLVLPEGNIPEGSSLTFQIKINAVQWNKP